MRWDSFPFLKSSEDRIQGEARCRAFHETRCNRGAYCAVDEKLKGRVGWQPVGLVWFVLWLVCLVDFGCWFGFDGLLWWLSITLYYWPVDQRITITTEGACYERDVMGVVQVLGLWALQILKEKSLHQRTFEHSKSHRKHVNILCSWANHMDFIYNTSVYIICNQGGGFKMNGFVPVEKRNVYSQDQSSTAAGFNQLLSCYFAEATSCTLSTSLAPSSVVLSERCTTIILSIWDRLWLGPWLSLAGGTWSFGKVAQDWLEGHRFCEHTERHV